MTDRARRLEAANQDRAEVAVRWEAAEDRADTTGQSSDRVQAEIQDRALEAADLKIKKIESER